MKPKEKVEKWWKENRYEIKSIAIGVGFYAFVFCAGVKVGARRQNAKWSETLMTIGAREVGKEAFINNSKNIKL